MSNIVPMEINENTTHQEVFDFVLNAIYKQGVKSTNDNGSCMYRATDNIACGIGHLLHDDEAMMYEGRTVGAIRKQIPRLLNISDAFLQRLQDCHDYSIYDSYFISGYLSKMQILANDYFLKYSPPDNKQEG